MIMADILKWLLVILGYLLIYISYWLVSQALFPGMVAAAREHYKRPARTTLIGLLVAVPLLFIGIAVMNLPNPILKVIGGTIAGIPVMFGLVGSAGLCQRIGEGLPSPQDATQPWRGVLRGGIVLTLTYLLPFIGWFVVPIWVLISGCGALVIALKQKGDQGAEIQPTMLTAPAKGLA